MPGMPLHWLEPESRVTGREAVVFSRHWKPLRDRWVGYPSESLRTQAREHDSIARLFLFPRTSGPGDTETVAAAGMLMPTPTQSLPI